MIDHSLSKNPDFRVNYRFVNELVYRERSKSLIGYYLDIFERRKLNRGIDLKKQFIGTHEFDGVYLISRPGLEGADGPLLNIEDIGPTILFLLGMPYADDLIGNVPPLLVEMLGFQPGQIASYETVVREGSDLPDDEATWEQLRGLGYIGDDPSKGD